MSNHLFRGAFKGWLSTWPIVAIFAFYLVLGSTFIYIGLREVRFQCERSGDAAICLRSVSVLGQTIRQSTIRSIRSAYLYESCDENGCDLYVKLETEQRFNPTVEANNGLSQADLVDAINTFIEYGDPPALDLTSQTPLIQKIFLVGFGILIIGFPIYYRRDF